MNDVNDQKLIALQNGRDDEGQTWVFHGNNREGWRKKNNVISKIREREGGREEIGKLQLFQKTHTEMYFFFLRESSSERFFVSAGTNFLDQWCLILLIRGSQSLLCWPRTCSHLDARLDSLFMSSRPSTSQKHHAPFTQANSQAVYLIASTTKFTLHTLPTYTVSSPQRLPGKREAGKLLNELIDLVYLQCQQNDPSLSASEHNNTICSFF